MINEKMIGMKCRYGGELVEILAFATCDPHGPVSVRHVRDGYTFQVGGAELYPASWKEINEVVMTWDLKIFIGLICLSLIGMVLSLYL